MVQYLGLALLLAWTFNIWAFLLVVEARPGMSRLAIWSGVLLIPVFGWIAWYLLGPRPARG